MFNFLSLSVVAFVVWSKPNSFSISFNSSSTFIYLHLLMYVLHHCQDKEISLVSVLLVLLADYKNLQYIFLGS